jgi:O-antigen/teichoic acid export membrane protein
VTGTRTTRVRRLLVGNVAARVGALVALALATVMVARAGGPDLVGAFTLLRVLPGLAGVLAALGLPGATPYFLASRRDDPRLRPTLIVLALLGACAATLGWLALTPLLHRVFFQDWGNGLVLVGALAVFTQLPVAVGKSLLQGEQDMVGANRAILAEEAAYPPVYAMFLLAGHGALTMAYALVVADVLVAAGIAWRLARAGFFRGWGRPSMALGREISGYGARGQLGGLLSLVNLRLDVGILGAIAGPAVLGVYAIASKYAELMRLPGLAVNYVLYPIFASRDGEDARARTSRLLLPALTVPLAVAVPLALAATPLLPLVYGHAFRGAVGPALILLAGLLGDVAANQISAYLYGVGRPGGNSLAIGVGVVLTVIGDVLLIPRYGAVGAAVASCVAYLATDAALFVLFRLARPARTDPAVDTTMVPA